MDTVCATRAGEWGGEPTLTRSATGAVLVYIQVLERAERGEGYTQLLGESGFKLCGMVLI